ncbi:MAG: hypothetical protein J0M33_20225 [Anaerolineae bacterium]|nr:hypothetical protein [Anaerolineae bacterium]
MKIGLRWRWILPLVMLIVFFPASAQDAVVQTLYACPTETEFRSETPFTRALVEDLLGFWHPLLQAVVDMPEPFIGNIYRFYASCTTYTAGLYVSLFLQDKKVLVFSLNESRVTAGAIYQLTGTRWYIGFSVSKMADRNFNGLPDWFVWGTEDGQQQNYAGLKFLEWGSDGVIYEVPLPSIEELPVGFDDIDGDGIPEVVDYLRYFIPLHPFVNADARAAHAWFGLRGNRYTMVAVEVQAFSAVSYYRPHQDSGIAINEFLSSIQLETICEQLSRGINYSTEYSFNERLFEILLYYQLWGKTNEGWAAIQPIWDAVALCPESEQKQFFFESIAEYGEYIAMRDSE